MQNNILRRLAWFSTVCFCVFITIIVVVVATSCERQVGEVSQKPLPVIDRNIEARYILIKTPEFYRNLYVLLCEIEGCEYIFTECQGGWNSIHKANCKNHKSVPVEATNGR